MRIESERLIVIVVLRAVNNVLSEVVALRYKTAAELLTKFSWGNTSSGNHSGQVVTVFGHSLNKEGWHLVGVFFPLILKRGVLYLPFCPLSLGLPLYTAEKTPTQSSLSPSTILIRCLYMLKRSVLIYLFWRPARPAAPASPSMSDVPIPWSSLWLFAGLLFVAAALCSCLSHAGEPKSGHNTLNVVAPVLGRGNHHLPWPAGSTFFSAVEYAVSWRLRECIAASCSTHSPPGLLFLICWAAFQTVSLQHISLKLQSPLPLGEKISWI